MTPLLKWLSSIRAMALSIVVFVLAVTVLDIRFSTFGEWRVPRLAVLAAGGSHAQGNGDVATVDLNWYPPNSSQLNGLETIINGTGTYGVIFNSSVTPPGASPQTVNYCNMPHISATNYPTALGGYKLEYVELVRSSASYASCPPRI